MAGKLCRRSLLGLMAAGTVTVLAGCDSAPRSLTAEKPREVPSTAIHVYRDPECGCCEAWAAHARRAGYRVTVESRDDMPAIKTRYGVPDALLSCHTAVVGDYAIEGHVPLENIARLLTERPKTVRGIAVPGMPRGSPGMEMPDGGTDRYKVLAFGPAGVFEFGV